MKPATVERGAQAVRHPQPCPVPSFSSRAASWWSGAWNGATATTVLVAAHLPHAVAELSRLQDLVEVIARRRRGIGKNCFSLSRGCPYLKLVACFATGYAGIDLGHLRSPRHHAYVRFHGRERLRCGRITRSTVGGWRHGILRGVENVRAGTSGRKGSHRAPPAWQAAGGRGSRRHRRRDRIARGGAGSVSSLVGPTRKAGGAVPACAKASSRSLVRATSWSSPVAPCLPNAGQIKQRRAGSTRRGRRSLVQRVRAVCSSAESR